MDNSAFIYIELDDCDKNKFLKVNKTELHSYFQDWDFNIPKFKIRADAKYIGIYCNYDGHLNGLGKTLLEHYNTKEKAMNLIACGWCLSIFDKVKPYYPNIHNKWKENFPEFNNDMCWRGAYTYLFKNGEWHLVENKTNKLTSLKNILK